MWFNIADLSDHCSVISLLRQGFVTGQVSLAWSIALCTHELYTRPRVLKERRPEDRTGFSSLNFFQAVFICVVVESSQPPAAESMSPRLQKEATTSSLSGPTWTSLCGLPSKGRAVPCAPVIRVLCQALEPTALLMHPVLTAFAEDAVAAHPKHFNNNLFYQSICPIMACLVS